MSCAAAVGMARGRAVLEASGGVTLDGRPRHRRDRGRPDQRRRADALRAGARSEPVGSSRVGSAVTIRLVRRAPMRRAMPCPPRLPMLHSLARDRRAQREVRALAAERDAVILAHNYQVPEVQDVADFVGDSLGLSREAADADAGDDRLLRRALHGRDGLDPQPRQDGAAARPRRRLLAGRLDHRRASCARWKAEHPGAVVVMYVNTTAEVKAETDYCCTSSNAVQVVEHICARARRGHRDPLRSRHVPRRLRRAGARAGGMRVWMGECHVHAGIRPSDIAAVRAEHPGAEFLIHPECGLLDLGHGVRGGRRRRCARTRTCSRPGGMLAHARAVRRRGPFIVATETGMLHPLRAENPGKRFVAANQGRLRLHEDDHAAEVARRAARGRRGLTVSVPADVAERARVPIERMVCDQPGRRTDGGAALTRRDDRPASTPPSTASAARADERPVAWGTCAAERPYLVLNMVDRRRQGLARRRTAGLGGAADRGLFQQLRTQADAVMAGAGTDAHRALRADGARPRPRRSAAAEGARAEPLACVVSRASAVLEELPLLGPRSARVALLTARATESSAPGASVAYVRAPAPDEAASRPRGGARGACEPTTASAPSSAKAARP